MFTITIEYEEDPNGYAGVRGTVEAELSRGDPVWLTLTDPWGNAQEVTAGEKPEVGRNGFSFLVSHAGDYVLTIRHRLQRQTFPLSIHGGEMAVVTVTPAAEPETPPPPTPAPPPPDGLPPSTIGGQPQLADLLARLDEILVVLQEHAKQHANPTFSPKGT